MRTPVIDEAQLPSVRDGFGSLVKYMASRDGREREYAAIALGALGDPRAMETLTRALTDDSLHVRRAAVESLGGLAAMFGDSRRGTVRSRETAGIRKVFLSMMTDADMDIREAAERQLSGLDRRWRGSDETIRHIPEFVRTLGENSPESAHAARVLGMIRDRRAMKPLLRALMNDSYDIRLQAETALDRIDRNWLASPEIRGMVPEFVAALEDPSESARKKAAEMVGTLGVTSAHDAVAARLSDTESVAGAALEALRIIGDERAILPIVRAVESGRVNEKKAVGILSKLMKENRRFGKSHPDILCSTCHCRSTVIRFKGRIPYWDKVFYVCRRCHMTANLRTGVRRVAGVIGGDAGSPDLGGAGDAVVVPLWNEAEKTATFADIDLLYVCRGGVESYQRAVNAVILELTGKLSQSGDWLKTIPVILVGKPTLSRGVENMLADYFQWVPGEAAQSPAGQISGSG